MIISFKNIFQYILSLLVFRYFDSTKLIWPGLFTCVVLILLPIFDSEFICLGGVLNDEIGKGGGSFPKDSFIYWFGD